MPLCVDQKEQYTEKIRRPGTGMLLSKTDKIKEIEIQYLTWTPKGMEKKLVENSVTETKDAIFKNKLMDHKLKSAVRSSETGTEKDSLCFETKW